MTYATRRRDAAMKEQKVAVAACRFLGFHFDDERFENTLSSETQIRVESIWRNYFSPRVVSLVSAVMSRQI